MADKVCEFRPELWAVCLDDHCEREHQYWGNSDWEHPRWGD